MDQHTVGTPNRSRAATKEGVGRYVLLIGTALVIVLFVVAYLIAV